MWNRDLISIYFIASITNQTNSRSASLPRFMVLMPNGWSHDDSKILMSSRVCNNIMARKLCHVHRPSPTTNEVVLSVQKLFWIMRYKLWPIVNPRVHKSQRKSSSQIWWVWSWWWSLHNIWWWISAQWTMNQHDHRTYSRNLGKLVFKSKLITDLLFVTRLWRRDLNLRIVLGNFWNNIVHLSSLKI